ncbi:MAG: hypothetical protein KIT22_14220, partial [Verrucomicrobiae bacterium]|nr:hypothetical protein [Verrucomicrobiae bacterium]
MIAFLLAAARASSQSCLTWVQRTDVGSPGQRVHHAMAYDSDRHVTVFFGGEIGKTGSEAYFNDTWEYDGVTWTKMDVGATVPSARSFHSMAYDPVQKVIIMRGGFAGGCCGLGDTWAYKHEAGKAPFWTRVKGQSQDNGLVGSAMVFNFRRGRIMDHGGIRTLFAGGGFGDDSNPHSSEWDGSTWNIFAEGPGAWGLAMAVDPYRQMVLAFGGYDGSSDKSPRLLPDTWILGSAWQDLGIIPGPAARDEACMAFDINRDRFVMMGGDGGDGFGSEVWEYQPEGGWQRGTPFPSALGRAGAAMVYDQKRGVIVMMGGAGAGAPNGDDGGRYSDTWELTPAPVSAEISTAATTVCKGDPLTLSLITSDPRMFQYQWSVGDSLTAIEGATTAVLNIPDNEAMGTVRYTVTMWDDCGNPFSRFVDITTHFKPELTGFSYSANPGAETLSPEAFQCPGGSIQLEVEYISDPPATLQWYRGSTALTGQTNATFSIDSTKKEDSGLYHLVLSNSCGTVDSRGTFGFTLQVGPAITNQPASVIANPCDGADFKVVAIGVGTLHYQWRMDGVPLPEGAPFAGTTTTNLHIESLVYSLEGTFDVVVTDDCGPETAVISSPASLALPTPPWVEVAMEPSPPEQENRRGNWVSAYDENRGILAIYGGTDSRGYRANSLWEYDGYTWTAIQDAYAGAVTTNGQNLFFNNSTPPDSYAAVYNPDDHLTYIFGGYSQDTPLTIWTWNGTNWHRPYSGPINGEGGHYRAVYDRLNHKILFTRTGNGTSSYLSELLVYDPASNILSPPQPMQPPLELGGSHAFWVYDEYRQLALWYQNDGVGFGPATMWALDYAMHWNKLSGTPLLPDYAFFAITYDPVRRHVVELGTGGNYPFDTSTRIFPASGQPGLPEAFDWREALPDGPPRNAAGLGLSPVNQFFPETIAFDRRRRALVAPGYAGPISVGNGPPFPVWTTYESRYKDAVEFDHPPGFVRPSIGGTLFLKAYAAGYGSLSYQWRHNGTEISDGVAGAG